jgi:hypothetical protein
MHRHCVLAMRIMLVYACASQPCTMVFSIRDALREGKSATLFGYPKLLARPRAGTPLVRVRSA